MAIGGATREVFAIFGVEVDPEHNLEKGEKEVSGLKESFEGLVAAFAGQELVHMTREFGEQLGQLNDLSEQTQVTADDIQALDFAAEQTGGSAEEMNNSLLLLTKSMKGVDAAASPQVKALKSLGISYRDAAGQPRPMNELLPEIYANFKNLKTGAQEAQVATALFGRAGIKLLPTLRQGTEGMQGFRDALDELGGPVPEETIAKAEEMNHAFGKLDRAFFSLKASIGAEVFPQIEKLLTGVAHGVAKFNEFAQGTTLAESGALALGVAVAGPLLTALGPLIKPGLKFAAIYLAMDDVIAFLEGKDSVIGAILNGFFGPETTQGVQQWLAVTVSDFKELFKSTGGIFRGMVTGWAIALNEMGTGFDEFVLGLELKWNELAETLHLPDALKFDTKDAEDRITEDKKVHDAYGQIAHDDTHPEEVKAREQEQQRAFDESNGYGVRVGNKLGKDEIRNAFEGPARQDYAEQFNPLAHFGGPKVLAPGGQSFLNDFLPPAQAPAAFGPPTAAAPFNITPPTTVPVPAQNNHTELHVDARTTVNATTNSSAKDVADLVGKTQKENWRNAYESITARSSANP